MSTSPINEQGWALISVLMVVTVLSMLAVATQKLVVTDLRAEQRAWETAKQESLLDAGLNVAVIGVIGQHWRTDGEAREFAFKGQSVRISIQDERGRIDLNSADGSILKELFRFVGANERSATRIAAGILDWRSPIGFDSPDMPTEADYKNRGYRARHGAFQSVDELKLVSGMSEQLFDAVEPLLTVYSKLPAVDETVAPRGVLAFINAVRQGIGGAESKPVSQVTSTESPYVGRTFSITLQAPGKIRPLLRKAVVLLTGDNTNPYLVLAWRNTSVRT